VVVILNAVQHNIHINNAGNNNTNWLYALIGEIRALKRGNVVKVKKGLIEKEVSCFGWRSVRNILKTALLIKE